MEKFKVLLVSDTYPPQRNGEAVFVQQLAQGLVKKGHNIAIIAPSPNRQNHIENYQGIKVLQLKTFPIKPIHPTYRPIAPWGLNRSIKRIIQTFQPDILHTQNHFWSGKAAIRQSWECHLPIVGTNHFMPKNLLGYFPGFLRPAAERIMWIDFVRTYNKLNAVTVPSKTAAQIMKKVGLKTPVFVISNGVALKKFQRFTVPDKIYRHFHLQKSLPKFISVGRLDKDKNLGLVIQAAKIVLSKIDYQILLVGDGKEEKNLKALSYRLGLKRKVIFTGRQSGSTLQALLSAADVYLAPGIAELQGIAVMEAMANSLPVLALKAVALPELVYNNINGFLFRNSPHDLAAKMIKTLANHERLQRMGKASLQLVQKHRLEKTVSLFEALYLKTITRYNKVINS